MSDPYYSPHTGALVDRAVSHVLDFFPIDSLVDADTGNVPLAELSTVDRSVPVHAVVIYEGEFYVYQLRAGTDAQSLPTIVRPEDYNGSTNAKVWALKTVPYTALPDASSSERGAIRLTGDLGGTAATPIVKKISEDFTMNGILTPATFSTDQNDYNPTGLSTANWLKIASTNFGSGNNVTGLAGGASGRRILIENVGSWPVVLVTNSSSSSAANRFATDVSISLRTNHIVELFHNGTNWKVLRGYVPQTSGLAYWAGDIAGGSDATSPALIQAGLGFKWAGVNTPSQYSANQNNLSLSTSITTYRISSDAARDITGISTVSEGRFYIFHNVGSFTITFKNESSSSTAANRFSFGQDIPLPAGGTLVMVYDNTTQRWRLWNRGVYLPLSGGTMSGRLVLGAVSNTQSVLTYGATADIDFDVGSARTIALTGNWTPTTSNKAAGKMVKIKILCDGSDRTLSWPSWIPIGVSALPTTIAANKTAILTLECWGSADTDITAAYAVQG